MVRFPGVRMRCAGRAESAAAGVGEPSWFEVADPRRVGAGVGAA